MTTPYAAAKYLASHQDANVGRGLAIYNPHNKPLEDLPFIIGFNNGGPQGMLSAVSIAQDGTCLGHHCCSDEGYMPYDLGILEGTRPDRHEESYKKHYPDGYVMDFVERNKVNSHSLLQEALRLNKEQADKKQEKV